MRLVLQVPPCDFSKSLYVLVGDFKCNYWIKKNIVLFFNTFKKIIIIIITGKFLFCENNENFGTYCTFKGKESMPGWLE